MQSTQARKLTGNRFPVILLAFLPAVLLAAEPSDQKILDSLRLAAFSSSAQLDGFIRHEGERTRVAIKIVPGQTVYSFPESGESFSLNLTERGAILTRLTADGSELVNSKDKLQSLAGSDLALGDLAFEFLYWENSERREDEKILGLPAYQIRLKAPTRAAMYAAVDAYVAKQSGAMLQVLCYDWDGKLAKRFKVIKGQRIDGRWTLQQMRIESFAPGSRRPLSRSYLEIEDFVAKPAQQVSAQ